MRRLGEEERPDSTNQYRIRRSLVENAARIDSQLLHDVYLTDSECLMVRTVVDWSYLDSHNALLAEAFCFEPVPQSPLPMVVALRGKVLPDDRYDWESDDIIPLDVSRDLNDRQRVLFRCPGLGKGSCDGVVRYLYRPQGEELYRCRECHNLAYRRERRRLAQREDGSTWLRSTARDEEALRFTADKARRDVEDFISRSGGEISKEDRDKLHYVVHHDYEFARLQLEEDRFTNSTAEVLEKASAMTDKQLEDIENRLFKLSATGEYVRKAKY
jgi:hypothetical protein